MFIWIVIKFWAHGYLTSFLDIAFQIVCGVGMFEIKSHYYGLNKFKWRF